MLRLVIGLGLAYRELVIAVSVAIFVLGAFFLRSARVDVLPEFDPVVVEVQTEALGLSAAEVEDLVTINLEEILTAAPYLQSIHSRSVPGLSSVLLTFEPGTELMRARQMVQERLTMAWALPNVSKPPTMLQPRSAAGRAMIIGLTSKEKSLIDMSVHARWNMTPKLLSVPGVANVAIWGQRARQLQVQVDTHKLQAKGVTLHQVITSAGEALWVSPLSYLESSVLGASGWIDTPNQRLGIQHVQPISKASDLSSVSIANSNLTLGDVATVVEEHPPLIGDAIVGGEAGIMLVVEKLPNADVNAVVNGLEDALAELSQGMAGITMDTKIYQSKRYLDTALANSATALAAGAALMAIAMLLSFRALRPTLVTLVAVGLSLTTVLLVLTVRAATINILDIAGMLVALVAVTDITVLAVEAIMRRQADAGGTTSAAEIVTGALGEIRQPVIYGTLIGLLVVVPVFALPGVKGAFFGPLAQTYMLALVAAVLVNFLVVPATAVLLLKRSTAVTSATPGRLAASYQRGLARMISRTVPVLTLFALAVLATAAAVPLLKWSPVPTFIERDTVVSWEAAPGTSLQGMTRLMKGLSDSLKEVPGVDSVSGHIGRAITGDQIVGIESGQIWLSISDAADYDVTMTALREALQQFPAIEASMQSYLTGTAHRVDASNNDPIVVRIEGAERGILEEQARRVAAVIAGVDNVADVRIARSVTTPEIQVLVDVAAAANHGLKPGDVRRTAATLFAGLEVGNLFEEQKVFDVVVWGTPAMRQSVTDINDVLIDGPHGTYVRLGDVAKVNFTAAPQVIERDGVTRSIDIRANVSGDSVATVVSSVKAQLDSLELPFEYHAYLRNDQSLQKADNRQFILIGLAAAILVYFLMQAAVQSWRLALLLCLAAFVSLSGGVAAILASGATVSLGSLAGLLAVFGFAIRGGLTTSSALLEAGERNTDVPPTENLLYAAGHRFMPLIATAVITILAFLPAAIMRPDAGLEILQPMAVTIIAGMVSALLVVLFLVPAILSQRAPRKLVPHMGGENHALTNPVFDNRTADGGLRH